MKISKVFLKKQSIVDGEKGFSKVLLFSDVLKKANKINTCIFKAP